MQQKELYTAIDAVINNMDMDDAVPLHNELCELTNRTDDRVYTWEELEDWYISNLPPDEAFRAGMYCQATYADDWLHFDGYGNLKAILRPDDLYIVPDDIIDHAEQLRDEDLLPDEISDLITDYNHERFTEGFYDAARERGLDMEADKDSPYPWGAPWLADMDDYEPEDGEDGDWYTAGEDWFIKNEAEIRELLEAEKKEAEKYAED